MGRERDQEVRMPGIIPKEHFIWQGFKRKRSYYPFEAMVIGDYFKLNTPDAAAKARRALYTFYRKYPGRRFTVRQREDAEWICRRVR